MLRPAPSRPWPSAEVSRRPTRLRWSGRWRRNQRPESPDHQQHRLPPCAHDGTQRRIVRPQDPLQQAACESGKKKDYTDKNVLLINALLLILFLSDTDGGDVHAKRIADATPSPSPARSRLLQDLGFLACTLPQAEILIPTKKPYGEAFTREQHLTN